MKSNKKLLSVILALALMIGAFVLPVSAASANVALPTPESGAAIKEKFLSLPEGLIVANIANGTVFEEGVSVVISGTSKRIAFSETFTGPFVLYSWNGQNGPVAYLRYTFGESFAGKTVNFPANAKEFKLPVSIVSAEFQGLTRIVVELTKEVIPSKSDIVIDNILSVSGKNDPGYWAISEEDIAGVAVAGTTVTIALTPDALKGENVNFDATDTRGQLAKKACVAVLGSDAYALPRQGAAVMDSDVQSVIRGSASNGCSLWHNVGTGNGNPYRIDRGVDSANWVLEGNRYDYAGFELNHLLIVFDFPDARGIDNTGIVGLPGDPLIDRANYVNGHRLQSAQDYFDWVSIRNKEFIEMATFGNIQVSWKLLANSAAGSNGIYSLPYSLYPSSYYLPGGLVYEADKAKGDDMTDIYTKYPWLSTNPSNWAGYMFARGGSTSNWLNASYGFPGAVGMRADFDALVATMPGGKSDITMVYAAAVENAVGITYGASYGGNGNIGTSLGLAGTKAAPTGANGPALLNYTFMGGDSFSSFKYKHSTHEFGHQMGLIDNYINTWVGYGSGYTDPYTGKGDYYMGGGGYDHMGYITGIAPDYWAWIKWKQGWFRDDQVVIIKAKEEGDFTVDLTPVETEGGTKLVVIIGESSGNVFCIEYRGGKLGVDNIKELEWSNDPFDPKAERTPGAYWDHSNAYGFDTKPGILMYRINLNRNTTDAHTSVVDLLPRSLDNSEGYNVNYSATLNKSLLGPTSGVFDYTDPVYGMTVSVDPSVALSDYAGREYDGVPYTVKISVPGTGASATPVLTNAEFIDMNTLQFQSNVDLRAARSSWFEVQKNGTTVSGLGINLITKNTVRLSFTGTPFTFEDITGSGGEVTVRVTGSTAAGTGNTYGYASSDRVKVGPSRTVTAETVGTVALSDVRFISATQFVAIADKGLGSVGLAASGNNGVAKSNIKVTKPDGTVLTSAQISSASYDRVAKRLTVNLASGVFANLTATIGTSVEIAAPVSNYDRTLAYPITDAVPYFNQAVWYHQVEMNKSAEAAKSLMASLSGMFDGQTLDQGVEAQDMLNIVGGIQTSPVRTKIEVAITGTNTTENAVTVSDLFVVNPVSGVQTPFAAWLAAFNATSGYNGYNGVNEFPMNGAGVLFGLTPKTGSEGNYTVTVTLSAPGDNGGEWAKLESQFTVEGPAPIVSSDDIKSIRLVEMGWIEIVWKNDMFHTNDEEFLTDPDNYKVMLGGQELQISDVRHWTPGWTSSNPGNAVVMTNLLISNWEEVAHHYTFNEGIYEPATVNGVEIEVWNGTDVQTGITLQLTGDLFYGTRTGTTSMTKGDTLADKTIVYNVLYEPYYKKIYEHRGFKLRFSGAVTESSMMTSINNFTNTFDHMMKKSDDKGFGFVERIAEWGMTAIFSGSGENLHWCPDYRGNISYNTITGISGGYGAGPGKYPVVGFGGTAAIGTLVHELMHCTDYLALRSIPEFQPWMEKFALFYADVVDQGMWKGTGYGANNQFGTTYSYALQNSGEFLAEMAQAFFQSAGLNNARPCTRDAFKIYAPDLYDMFAQIFYEETVPGGNQTQSTFNTPFLRKYVPNANQAADDGEVAYVFGDRNDSDPIAAGHYFSILSFAKSHILGTAYLGDQFNTWWDYSHTSYNYDFNGLSWIVTPVDKDGKTYYHFTSKGNNPNQITGANTPASEQFGDGTGIPGVFYNGPNAVVVTALGVKPENNVVNGMVTSVPRNLDDDNQLWSFVSYAGRAGVLINKASGLTLGTEGDALPGDGTMIVLRETKSKPANSSVWYVRQLKPRPTGGVSTSLTANKYCLKADKEYALMDRTWFDKDDRTVIWIEWDDAMPSDIAGNAANWVVTANRGMLDEKVFEIDPSGTYNVGRYTRIKLVDVPTDVEYSGLGTSGPGAIMRVHFTGNMVGLETGLPADNGYEYYFRVEQYEAPAITVYHTVTFDADNGDEAVTVQVEEGQKATKPADPEKEGFTFLGWFADDLEFDFDTPITGNVTLTAHWEAIVVLEDFTVTFNADNGSALVTVTVTEGDKVEEPADPEKEGYTFLGWYLNGTKFDFDTAITADIELIAQWEENEVEPEKITSIKIDAATLVTMARGETRQFSVIVNPTDAEYNLVWTVSNTALAKVENGIVTIYDKAGMVSLKVTDTITGLSHTIAIRIS